LGRGAVGRHSTQVYKDLMKKKKKKKRLWMSKELLQAPRGEAYHKSGGK
jgi:hypothetical protein